MRLRDDESQNLWHELLAAALKDSAGGIQPATPSVGLGVPDEGSKADADALPEARSLGVIKELGSILSGPVSSIMTQAGPSSGGASWLKWLNPIAGLVSLFAGPKGEEQPETGPVLSARLPTRRVEYGLSASEGGSFKTTDADERGRVRVAESKAADSPQVVVQVQAMDSRSFLDNRDEIASAVRQALMESHGLGTVLREFQE